MTREEAKEVFLNRGIIDGIYNGDKWREACIVISKWLEQEPIHDKIREQIKDYLRGVEITLEVLVENDPLRPKMEGAKDTLEECLELIDRAESEDKEQTDDNT
jgi:hypothetical protein